MPVELTLREIAGLVGGTLEGDGAVRISGVAAIEEAGEGDITFVSGPRYLKFLSTTRASAAVLGEGAQGAETGRCMNLIRVKEPHLALAAILDKLRPAPVPEPGIHPGALVHPDSTVGSGVSIQAFAVVGKGAVIGDKAVLYPGVYIGDGAVIGERSVLYPNVTVREGCRIGARVIVHPGAVIGSDGFGYVRKDGRHRKIPQRGIVEIGDDAEIGASVTIDRATMGRTVIGRGTKIDNLVQIAHNVRIGEDTIIVAQAGVAGSTTIGSRVTLAGQAGVAGHIDIADDCTVGPQAGVTRALGPGGVYSGFPAIPHGEWLRASALFAKLPEMKKRLAELEKRLGELERAAGGGRDKG